MADYKRLFAGIPLMIAALFLSTAAAGETRVCPDGCQISDIQAAISYADPGDIVTVESGTYAGNLVAGKAVTLQGHDSGSGMPVLAGSITAAADGGKISGFQFAGLKGIDGGDSCMLNIMGPIGIYQNNIPGSGWVCPGSSGLWNSSALITYQFESRIYRGRMGNYWADYAGEDKNQDGIGDQPKVIDEETADYYPLIQPIESYRISTTGITGEENERVELIRATVNEPFIIELDSNPTTGYKWFVDYDYNLLGLEDESYEKEPSELLGAGGRSVFAFKPLKTGRTAISFVYRRSWENIAADVRKYYVEIDA